MLEGEASSDFERLLTEQDRSDTVLVPDIVRHREEAGEEDRRGYRREPRAGRSGDDSDRPRQSPHPGRRRGRSPPVDPPSGPTIPRSARPSRSRSRVSRVPETSPRDEEKDLPRGLRQKSLREDVQFESVAFMEKEVVAGRVAWLVTGSFGDPRLRGSAEGCNCRDGEEEGLLTLCVCSVAMMMMMTISSQLGVHVYTYVNLWMY